MTTLLVIHLIIVIALIISILLQRSTADGFSGGGSSGGMDSFLTPRSSASLLTRATGVLAALFIASSLFLAYLSSHSNRDNSILDGIETTTSAPALTDADVRVPAADDESDTSFSGQIPSSTPANAAPTAVPVAD